MLKTIRYIIKIIFLFLSSFAIFFAMYKLSQDKEISVLGVIIIFAGLFIAWLSSVYVLGLIEKNINPGHTDKS